MLVITGTRKKPGKAYVVPSPTALSSAKIYVSPNWPTQTIIAADQVFVVVTSKVMLTYIDGVTNSQVSLALEHVSCS